MSTDPQTASQPSKNSARKRVLIIGLDPYLLDFSAPEYAFVPGLTAEQVAAGLAAAQAHLNSLGYDAHQCMIDLGETAEAVVRARLQQEAFDCILIGAGVRKPDASFLLFERLLNVIHELAPKARICFNTRPTDTAEAVLRWV